MERFFEAPRGGVDPCKGLVVREGTVRDYDEPARLHYRAGRPATVVKVLKAEATGSREQATGGSSAACCPLPVACSLVGVLVVSMPTLNGRWRRAAWPELC